MWGGQNGGGLVMVIYQCSELSVLVFDFLPNVLSAELQGVSIDHHNVSGKEPLLMCLYLLLVNFFPSGHSCKPQALPPGAHRKARLRPSQMGIRVQGLPC
jgi:hypothetical protein